MLRIPLHGRSELRFPKFLAGARRRRTPTPFVAMPETTMYEDDEPVLREHEIGRPGKILPVKSKPQSHAMRNASHAQLRGSVFASNFRHHRAATGRIDGVDQGAVRP